MLTYYFKQVNQIFYKIIDFSGLLLRTESIMFLQIYVEVVCVVTMITGSHNLWMIPLMLLLNALTQICRKLSIFVGLV